MSARSKEQAVRSAPAVAHSKQAEETPEVEVETHDPLNDPTGYDAPTGAPGTTGATTGQPVTLAAGTQAGSDHAKEMTAPSDSGGRSDNAEEEAGKRIIGKSFPAQYDINPEDYLPAQSR